MSKFQKGLAKVAALAVLATSMWAGVAMAQTAQEKKMADLMKDETALAAAIKASQSVTFFCANCHGADGNSSIPEVPNLAGQNAAFLLEQIRKFGTGQRKNEFMQKLIKVLKEEDKVNLAAFYASQKVTPRAGGSPELLVKGKDWYGKICFRCHGDQGQGNEKIARIAGQQPKYLTLTLTRYRDRTGERIDPLMAANTNMLKDQDIAAIVEYVSRMH